MKKVQRQNRVETKTPTAVPEDNAGRGRRIWRDCPACAYKHIAAAYAALTSVDVRVCIPSEEEIMRARAVIAEREARSGYPGNIDLRNGCLAMAEVLAGDTVSADGYRMQRLFGSAKTGLPSVSRSLPASAFGYAHIAEAIRELPELTVGERNLEALDALGVSGPTGFVLDWLADTAAWIRETYELEQGGHE